VKAGCFINYQGIIMFATITAGNQPFNDWFAPDTVQRHPLGFQVDAVDPFWGGGRFIYVKSGDAILKGSLVMFDEQYTAVLLPNTASQQFPFGIAMAPSASGTYGWLQIAGRAVIKTNATVAADAAMGVTAAGIAGAYSTLKGFVGVRNRKAATGTETIANVNVKLGSSALYCVNGYDGAFLGAAITSGSGIPISSVVAKLLPDGKTIMMGSAIGTVDKISTADGTIASLTLTYTGYGSALINNPSCTSAVA
jgi:hypothetical protein